MRRLSSQSPGSPREQSSVGPRLGTTSAGRGSGSSGRRSAGPPPLRGNHRGSQPRGLGAVSRASRSRRRSGSNPKPSASTQGGRQARRSLLCAGPKGLPPHRRPSALWARDKEAEATLPRTSPPGARPPGPPPQSAWPPVRSHLPAPPRPRLFSRLPFPARAAAGRRRRPASVDPQRRTSRGPALPCGTRPARHAAPRERWARGCGMPGRWRGSGPGSPRFPRSRGNLPRGQRWRAGGPGT